MKKAAKAVGMTAAKAYDCRDRDSAFARAWNQALERSYDAVELSLIQQGLNGTRRTEAVRKGTGASSEPVKWVHSFSPAVALRLLLAHRASVAALRKPREALVENEDVIGQVQARMDVMRARHGLTVLDLDDHDGPDGAE